MPRKTIASQSHGGCAQLQAIHYRHGLMAFLCAIAIGLAGPAAAQENTEPEPKWATELKQQIRDQRHQFDRTQRLLRETLMHEALGDIAHIEKIRLTGPALGEDYTNDRIERVGAGAFIRENPLVFWAYVFVPKAFASGTEKLPLLVYPHGGVHSNFQIDGGHLMRELLAQGYMVIAPDYRGSTGYGKGFYESIDYGGKEIADTKAARDFVVEQYSIVDPARVGIMGHSHGGLHTLMNLFEYPDAYKVGFADVPVSDLIARMGYKTDGYRDLYSVNYHIGKTAYAATEEYMKRSPAWNAEKLQTPLLIYTNTNDEDVNVLEVQLLIRALKAAEKDFEYEVFEDVPGGHKHARMDHEIARAARLRAYGFLAERLSPPLPLTSLEELEKAGYLFHGRAGDTE
ncbi:MAG: alpha/beta fold hydrolase [Pseudomonadota bacterium]